MAQTPLIEQPHPLDPTITCLLPAIRSDNVLDGGMGYWINAPEPGQTVNTRAIWCAFDKKNHHVPMECIIVAKTYIPSHTQLLCDYNNTDQRAGFN